MKIRVVLLLILSVGLLPAQTLVSGSVSGTWTARDNPFQLNGNVLIEVGDTLIIENDVTIDLGGLYELRVAGTLLAQGAAFHHGGSLFGDVGNLMLQACDFIGLNGGLKIYGGQAELTNCLIDSTIESGITLSGTDSSAIQNSSILNSGDYGLKISQTDQVSITDNYFSGNSTHDFNHPALFIDSCSPQTIEQNILEDNHAQGIGVWSLTATASPVIRNNLIRGNYTGITVVNSPPLIEGNIIVANFQAGNSNSGAGIYAGYPNARGIVSNNLIAGNYYGVSNINNAALNLGDMVNDFPGDDGENIFYDNSFNHELWNIWNATNGALMAQNNYWPGLSDSEIDATLWDDEEGGSEVVFEPRYVAVLPLPPDVNDDSLLNILDVVLVIENTLSQGVPDPIQFYLADINQDYSIDVNDVVVIIAAVING